MVGVRGIAARTLGLLALALSLLVVGVATRSPLALLAGFLAMGTSVWVLHAWTKSGARDALVARDGDARFATVEEVKRAGLMDRDCGDAIVVGALRTWCGVKPMLLRGAQHVLLTIRSGGGKGVAVIVPTLLRWVHSAVVLDVKGDSLWKQTSARRTELGRCGRLAFGSTDSLRWNPLTSVHTVAGADRVAGVLLPAGNHGGNQTFHDLACTAWAALVVCERWAPFVGVEDGRAKTPPPGHVGSLCQAYRHLMCQDPAKAIDLALTYDHLPDEVRHSLRDRLKTLREARAETLASSVMVARNALGAVFGNATLAANTSGRGDFVLRDLLDAQNPMTVYLSVPKSDGEAARPLVRLFVELLVDESLRGPGKRKCLLVGDEFCDLQLPSITRALDQGRECGLRLLLACQSFAQIRAQYGSVSAIAANCVQVCATAGGEDAAQISQALGSRTEEYESVSDGPSGRTVTRQRRSVPLLAAHEVLRLPALRCDDRGKAVSPGTMLVEVPGLGWVQSTQSFWFSNRETARWKEGQPLASSRAGWVQRC